MWSHPSSWDNISLSCGGLPSCPFRWMFSGKYVAKVSMLTQHTTPWGPGPQADLGALAHLSEIGAVNRRDLVPISCSVLPKAVFSQKQCLFFSRDSPETRMGERDAQTLSAQFSPLPAWAQSCGSGLRSTALRWDSSLSCQQPSEWRRLEETDKGGS